MSFEEKLISEVEKYRCLYNLQSSKYKNIVEKDRAWQTIAIHLDATAETCKKRWKTLRDRYKRQKHQLQLPSGSAAPDFKRYKYADQLRFLDDVPSSRMTTGNITEHLESVEHPSPLSSAYGDPSFPSSAENSLGTQSTRSRGEAPLPQEIENLLGAAQSSMDTLNSILGSQAMNGTIQLMSGLATRIVNSGLTDDEVIEIESGVSTYVFSKIQEIKNRKL